MIRRVIPMYQIIYSSLAIKRCISVNISFLYVSHYADIINNCFKKIYYFNTFSSKKYFKKQSLLHCQTLFRLASIRGLGSLYLSLCN
jgi:hypothetical protein